MSQTGLQCDKLWKELWEDKEARRWHVLAGFIFETWNISTKNRHRSPLTPPLQNPPPVGSLIYSFVNSMIILSHVLLELMLKSIDWPISDEFGDVSRHFIFTSWNAIMELMEPTVQTAIKGFGCCWPCSAKMHLYGTKTKQQHSALACQQRFKVFAFFCVHEPYHGSDIAFLRTANNTLKTIHEISIYYYENAASAVQC